MNITNIRIFPNEGASAFKASVGIVVDNAIAFHGLAIVENGEGELFVSLPARKNVETGRYEEVFFNMASAEAKKDLNEKILAAWAKMKEAPEQNSFDMGDPDAEMNISSIRIMKGKENLPDMASAVLDGDIVLSRLRILKDRETGEPWVAMADRKMKDGSYKDVYHPITAEARKALSDVVLAAYNAQKETSDAA